MRIWAIDPGPVQSALVLWDGQHIREAHIYQNADLITRLLGRMTVEGDVLVVEQIAAMGMAVGAEVFETAFWSGRFIQAWAQVDGLPWGRLKRGEIKLHLCGSMRAKDANIRQALIDRFGATKAEAIGTKGKQGPLYGVKGDEWAALAVGMTWWDRYVKSGAQSSDSSLSTKSQRWGESEACQSATGSVESVQRD